MKRSAVAFALALLFFSILQASARAGNRELEEQLRSDYVGKVMTLRHFYSGDHLRFRSDGTLQGDASVGPWTVDGQAAVEEIHLHGNTLEIKGRRIYVEFDAKSKPADALATIADYQGKDREDIEKMLREAKVTVEIDLPSGTPDYPAVSSGLRAVFLAPGESMMEVVPDYWRHYFAELEGRPDTLSKPPEKLYVFRPNTGMSAPKLTSDPEPEYSDVARKLKYQGTIFLSLIADPAGTARDFQITHPLGLGLDQQAVAAVTTWKFDPATKDGVPVPVRLVVEVTFRLY